MRIALCCAAALLIASIPLRGAPMQSIDLPNGDFEEDLKDWKVSVKDSGTVMVRTKSAKTGTLGLLVTDRSETDAVQLVSGPVPVKMGCFYRVSFQARLIEGSGSGVRLRFLDADRKVLEGEHGRDSSVELRQENTDWTNYTCSGTPPAGSVALQIAIRTNGRAVVKAEFDDFQILELPPQDQ